MVKTIRIGSDFSGLDTSVVGLRKVCKDLPGIKVVHTHSCDNNKVCKKIILHNSPPCKFFDDVLNRDIASVPTCDVYCFTAPCQAFSTAGKGLGVQDPRGAVIFAALSFIEAKKPKAILSENVPAFATRHKDAMQFLIKTIEEYGYHVWWKILCTEDYGIPQARKRWYMMAVKKSCCRTRMMGVSTWPTPLGYGIPLQELVTPVLPSGWRALPEHEPARTTVKNAYEKVVIKGCNPFVTPVVVDIGASPGWQTHAIAKCPTLTRSRTQSFGYWVSTKGGPLTIKEVGRLQGFDDGDIDWEGAGVSVKQYAGCLGNAQSLNVVCEVLPHLLFMAQLVNKKEFMSMTR